MNSADEPTEDHPSLDSVTRSVMWGEDSEEILESLSAQGVPDDDAALLVDLAMSDRAQTIRGIFWPRIVWGSLLLVAGVVIFWIGCTLTDFDAVFRTRRATSLAFTLFSFPTAAAIYGLWMFSNGLIGVITANCRTGAIADIE
ncbi:MAG: hypothetical protein V4727_11250 [Verrucomicrobiota bacterium]